MYLRIALAMEAVRTSERITLKIVDISFQDANVFETRFCVDIGCSSLQEIWR
jgi:hypothetical protein